MIGELAPAVFLQISSAGHLPRPSSIALCLVIVVLVCSVVTALLFICNLWLFVRPGTPWNRHALPKLSVLIPARNESASITVAVQSVLASRGVHLELIVLDDASTDDTASKVQALAEQDARVRLEAAPLLPEGWNGKQHACWVLASLAQHEVLCFLDADVQLGEEALYRMLSELSREKGKLALVSGFPRQLTKSFLEWILLPLIHFVLLGFLPLAGERWSGRTGFAAGCGQFLMVRREAYFASGGHAAIRTTMHDGLLLPQLLRRYGFMTRIFDLSRDATCRMYHDASEVWNGLGKNATEGMAAPQRLPIFSVLLLCGQVLPLPLFVWSLISNEKLLCDLAGTALVLGYIIRILSAWRYRQDWRGVALHPIGVLILLFLQWNALLRKLRGRPAIWKQRSYQAR
jgi:glycosyltransferase involved in cell wall biosynthesis